MTAKKVRPLEERLKLLKTSFQKRQQQKKYYEQNKKRLQEYQNAYNRKRKNKAALEDWQRGRGRYSVTGSAILHSSPEKAAKLIDAVLRGDLEIVGKA
jgi:hypothetical protein